MVTLGRRKKNRTDSAQTKISSRPSRLLLLSLSVEFPTSYCDSNARQCQDLKGPQLPGRYSKSVLAFAKISRRPSVRWPPVPPRSAVDSRPTASFLEPLVGIPLLINSRLPPSLADHFPTSPPAYTLSLLLLLSDSSPVSINGP